MREQFRRHLFVDTQLSIREGFKKYTDIPFKYVENGEMVDKSDAPMFILIEDEVNYETISKQREAVQVSITYKIELFGRNIMELKEMQGDITEYVLFDDIKLIHHKTGDVIGMLDVSPSFMGLEYLKEVTRESDYYRRHFFIDVVATLHKNLGGN